MLTIVTSYIYQLLGVKIGEEAKVYINLDNAEYPVSKIVLSTDIYIEPTIDVTGTNIVINNSIFNSQTREFSIDGLTGGTICISYVIPNYIAIGTKINLTLKTYEGELEKESLPGEINVISNIDVDTNTNTNTENNENTISENNENKIIEGESNNTNNMSKDVMNGLKSGNMNIIEQDNNQMQSNFKNSSNIESVTYKGSRNNYLKGITINGYELNPIFHKTNNTYFITVSEDINSVSITTSKEDSSAEVTVSGNTDLKTGINKVLISVLAKNGDVRYYRVYVMKEG